MLDRQKGGGNEIVLFSPHEIPKGVFKYGVKLQYSLKFDLNTWKESITYFPELFFFFRPSVFTSWLHIETTHVFEGSAFRIIQKDTQRALLLCDFLKEMASFSLNPV